MCSWQVCQKKKKRDAFAIKNISVSLQSTMPTFRHVLIKIVGPLFIFLGKCPLGNEINKEKTECVNCQKNYYKDDLDAEYCSA